MYSYLVLLNSFYRKNILQLNILIQFIDVKMDFVNRITQEIANTLDPFAGLLNNIVQDELQLEKRRAQEVQERNNQLTSHLAMCFLAHVNSLDRNEISFSVLRFHSRKLLRRLESSRLNRRFANPEREEMFEVASGVEKEIASGFVEEIVSGVEKEIASGVEEEIVSGVVSQVLAEIVSKVVTEVENIHEADGYLYDELD